MDKHENLGDGGKASHTHGGHELKAEHMARTSGVVPSGSVPPPDAEQQHQPHKDHPHKDKKEGS